MIFPMTVYVIENSHGSMYIGITRDIANRLVQHRAGLVPTSKKTGNWASFKLSHNWVAPSYSLASRFERYLHSIDKGAVLDLILDCPFWNNYLEELALTKVLQEAERLSDLQGKQVQSEYDLVSLPNDSQRKGLAEPHREKISIKRSAIIKKPVKTSIYRAIRSLKS